MEKDTPSSETPSLNEINESMSEKSSDSQENLENNENIIPNINSEEPLNEPKETSFLNKFSKFLVPKANADESS
jgi:hypothetical protein